jgi:phenylalanyl-tRNA synthetase beta chain
MRMTLAPNLKEFTRKVINERGHLAMFFEVGKIYLSEDKNYLEKRRLGLIFWNSSQTTQTFWRFKGYLESLFTIINLHEISFEEEGDGDLTQVGFKILFKEKQFAFGGQIEKGIFFAEVDLDEILGHEQPVAADLWPKFPPIIEDLSFIFPVRAPVGPAIQSIRQISSLVKNVDLIDSFEETRTFRITFQHPDKSLTDMEVKEIRERIINLFKKKSIRLKT